MTDRIELMKAVLKFYNRINKLVIRYDSLIQKAALKSYRTSCGEAAECIMALMEKKTKLINLKCNIDVIVSDLCREKKRIAAAYMRGEKTNDIINSETTSMRTTFRHIISTLDSVYKAFARLGFDAGYFHEEYNEFAFLTDAGQEREFIAVSAAPPSAQNCFAYISMQAKCAEKESNERRE